MSYAGFLLARSDTQGSQKPVYPRNSVENPFLEAESCSIYAERPVTCREFLVVSPPEHCAQPGSREVQAVRLPLRVFNALARMHAPWDRPGSERAVPLILAPEWAEAHADEPPAQPGPDLLRDLLRHLSMKPED